MAGDPLCGEQAVYAGFALTLDRIKASPEATGRALQSKAVAWPRTGLFSPA